MGTLIFDWNIHFPFLLTGVTYYNEEWAPVNDPAWHDRSGEPFWHSLPAELDWISYDFYSFHNISWLQPMCEYQQNLYPKSYLVIALLVFRIFDIWKLICG